MRNAFIATLLQAAREDPRIWLLTGDLGYSVLEGFAAEFPDRFLNVGVAEQNMTGIAAGLAMSGKVVFTYSIANFPVVRCLEQIRNDVCYHNLNVKVVAVGGGLAYGSAGYSHFAVEDLAVMRALPNMTVLAPGDPVETRLATRAVITHPGPCYLRLGKAGEPIVHSFEPPFEIGRALTVREGDDVAMLTTGGVLKLAVDTAELLQSTAGISTRVVSVPTVKPLDEAGIRAVAARTPLLCVIEEHSETGGLSDAVARCLLGMNTAVEFVAVDTEALLRSQGFGSHSYLAARSGLAADRIAARVRARLER